MKDLEVSTKTNVVENVWKMLAEDGRVGSDDVRCVRAGAVSCGVGIAWAGVHEAVP